jgi:uncharacterized membrane protein YhaH (DUF805 family)
MNYLVDVFKKYAVFSGRSRRKEYWIYVLIFGVVMSILQSLTGSLGTTGLIILAIFGLANLLPFLAVAVRRLHDTGKSGWFLLVNLIPFIGSIWFLILTIKDSQQGSNQYGNSPK